MHPLKSVQLLGCISDLAIDWLGTKGFKVKVLK